jgi:negative regulator of sigma E activity
MKKIYLLIVLTVLMQQINIAQSVLSNLRVAERTNSVEVTWTATTEGNMQSHMIERSSNGSAFSSIGTLVAQNNNTSYQYSFIDATTTQGPNYYRIRSISRGGEVTLSPVIRIDMGADKTNVVIVPNPVQNGIMNIQMNNLERGKYNIILYNSGGQRVYAYSMDYTGGYATQRISLPATVGKGTHFLQINNGSTVINKQVLLQ